MGLEINERIFKTYEDAKNQLQSWREFYRPVYGWVVVKAWIKETPNGFCAHIEAHK